MVFLTKCKEGVNLWGLGMSKGGVMLNVVGKPTIDKGRQKKIHT